MTARSASGILPFVISRARPKVDVTAHAGLHLLVELLRAVCRRQFWRRLARAIGLASWRVARRHTESILLLIAAGGDCLDDLTTLRQDQALARMLGFVVSSPTQAKEFLYAFHQTEDGQPLTREDDRKAGSVEAGHRIMKEGLAGGSLPCGRFSANAVRWRLNALLHNFLTMLKTEALPAGYARLAPKAMRFRLFNLPGALVRHARRLVLTIAAPSAVVEVIIAARQALAALAEILRPRPHPR
jgi:hypothetical protein